MTLDDLRITLTEKKHAGKIFLDLAHEHKYEESLKYYRGLHPEIRQYIREESNCGWQYLVVIDAIRLKQRYEQI